MIATSVCKNFFLKKQRYLNYFCNGCPKSDLRGGKHLFFYFFSIGASATKSLESQEFSGMGCMKYFLAKRKKSQGRVKGCPNHGSSNLRTVVKCIENYKSTTIN